MGGGARKAWMIERGCGRWCGSGGIKVEARLLGSAG